MISINHSSSVTNPPVTINTIALTQGAQANNNEIDRANMPEETTEINEEATLPQISIFDRETVAPGVRIICYDDIINCTICFIDRIAFFFIDMFCLFACLLASQSANVVISSCFLQFIFVSINNSFIVFFFHFR